MDKEVFFLHGQDGLWEFISWHDFEDDVVFVFRNIGSGRYAEVIVNPFSYIANNKCFFANGIQNN